MTIDKQKLQKLLWAEAASYRADCADWKRNTEALQEFLGEKTLEEVALELLAENERLDRARLGAQESLNAIDKHLRGNVNDPDPLPLILPGAASRTTTYGLVAGIRRERDQLKVDLKRIDADRKACWAEFKVQGLRLDGLKAEAEDLRESNDKLTRRNGMLEQNVEVMTEAHVLYTWLRKKVDQPSNDQVAVQMNIGHDWVPVQDLDRDLRTMIDREEP